MKKLIINIFPLFLSWFIHHPVLSQQGITVLWNDSLIQKEFNQLVFQSPQQADSAILSQYTKEMAAGFWNVKIDTIRVDSSKISCFLTRGEKNFSGNQKYIHQNRIIFQSDSKQELATVQQKKYFNSAFSSFENNGYPFVSATLIQIDSTQHEWQFTWSMIPGPLITYDSIVYKSSDRLPQTFISRYINFRKGEKYNEGAINDLEKRLREIQFLQVTAPPQVYFTEKSASLYLFLKKKKANYFNGVIGVQPNDQTGKITITGDAEIKLINSFNTGEELFLNWKRIQAQTQDFNVRTAFPFLFKTPIGIEGDMKIYRRDSTFSSIKLHGGFFTGFGGRSRIKLFIEKNTTSGLSSLTTSFSTATSNQTLYGLNIQLNTLDYRFNPRKGILLDLQGAAGKRSTRARSTSTEIPPLINHPLFRIQGSLESFLPTFKKQTIRLGWQGGALETPDLYDNELYRIGGLKTLRGVDEEQIFASAWSVFSIEYRYLLDQNSALYIYVDQGWYEKNTTSSFVTDSPLGFGLGINLDTKGGIFTFNYGLAQQLDNPLLVRNAKLSFGFRNLF